jgi:hypothetical protein
MSPRDVERDDMCKNLLFGKYAQVLYRWCNANHLAGLESVSAVDENAIRCQDGMLQSILLDILRHLLQLRLAHHRKYRRDRVHGQI